MLLLGKVLKSFKIFKDFIFVAVSKFCVNYLKMLLKNDEKR